MDKIHRYLKIGELAEITGITVRTLHYYDEVGLLKPVKVTEAGHRLYDMQSITELYRIIAMKDMGFSLEEIKKLNMEKDINIHEMVEIQLYRIQEEIAQKQLLCSKLLKLKRSLEENDKLLLEDFQEMVQFINASADKYFTMEQFDKLKNNNRNINEGLESTGAWTEFISKLEDCRRRKLPKTDLAAIECAEYWKRLTGKLIGNDEKMKESVLSFHASPESSKLKYGLTNELYEYLMYLIS